MTETRTHLFKRHSERGGAFCNQDELCHEPNCGLPASAEVHRVETCRDPDYCAKDGVYQCGCRTPPARQPEAPGHTDLLVTPESLVAPQPEAKEVRIVEMDHAWMWALADKIMSISYGYAVAMHESIVAGRGAVGWHDFKQAAEITTVIAAAFAGRDK